MMYTYSLTENDFITHQLYVTSTSVQVQKKRRRAWIVLTAAFLVLSAVYLMSKNYYMATFFALISTMYAFFYRKIQRRQYIRHFTRHVRNNYQNRIGEEIEIGVSGEHLIANSKVSEGKILIAEIVGVSEISDLALIHVSTGESLIVPQRMDGYREFLNELRSALSNQQVEWVKLPDWEYR